MTPLVDPSGSGTARYDLSPPGAGWTPGKYRVEAVPLDDTGARKGVRTAAFTVAAAH